VDNFRGGAAQGDPGRYPEAGADVGWLGTGAVPGARTIRSLALTSSGFLGSRTRRN